jgi:hypothetical protein
MPTDAHSRCGLLIALACAAAASPASAIEIGVRDTFQDLTVQDWFGANPVNVANGGPTGVGDAYLGATSTGTSGQASKMAVYNGESRWIGDYLGAGVTSLEADMINFSSTTLEMRVVCFSATGARWTSHNSVLLAPDGQWHHLSFGLDSNSMVSVLGSDTYTQMITNVSRIMFRHDSGGPSAGGTAVAASAGFDNITAVPGPAGIAVLGLGLLLRRRR